MKRPSRASKGIPVPVQKVPTPRVKVPASRCPVCLHERVDQIRAELCQGRALPEVGKAYSLSVAVLLKHLEQQHDGTLIPPEEQPIYPAPALRGGPLCHTCESPHRQEIERRMLDGEPLLAIQREFASQGGPSYESLKNHAQTHFAVELEAVRGELRAQIGGMARERCKALMGRAEDLLAKGEALVAEASGETGAPAAKVSDRAKSLQAAAALVGQSRGCVETLAKITGEIQPAALNVQTIVASPDFGRIAAALVGALRPWPDALAAAERALRGLDGGPVALPEAG